jgi:hypothetical protein
MSKLACAASILAGLMLMTPATTLAGPTVFLSSPENLSDLTVGELVTIDVNLQGLPVGSDFIFNLNTKILFSSSLFQSIPDPSTTSGLTAVVAPGSVFYNFVDGPLQVANFDYQSAANGGLTAGSANGIFAQFPNTNSGAIGLDGLYYSFTLKAIAAGSGSILFDPTPGANEYAADDTGFNYAPLPNLGPLPFTISAASVPEPSSITLGLTGLLVGLGCAWSHRRRLTMSAGRSQS